MELLADDFGQGRALRGLAVHQKNFLEPRRERAHPFDQLALIGVAAQLVQRDYFRPKLHRLAEDRNLAIAVQDLAAERILRLESGNEYCIPWIRNIVPQ